MLVTAHHIVRYARCMALKYGGMQVVLHPEFGPPAKGVLAWTWVTLILASIGLVFLYKTTTADPGFLPCGLDETRAGRDKVCFALSPVSPHMQRCTALLYRQIALLHLAKAWKRWENLRAHCCLVRHYKLTGLLCLPFLCRIHACSDAPVQAA